jgi:putative oxidoreductase
MDSSSKWVSLAGRVGLGLIFLISGIGKIGNFAGTAGFMASKGMPAAPLLLVGAIVFELFGALSVMTGVKTRWGVLALLIFLAPSTFIFHNFWAVSGPQQREQTIQFLKNLAIAGGLLSLWVAGPGALSVDAKLAGRSR